MKTKTILSVTNTEKLTIWKFILCIFICLLQAGIGAAQEPIWAKSVSGSGYEFGIDNDLDSQGNLFIIGYSTYSTLSIDSSIYNTNGDGDAFIAKLSSTHQLLWFKTLGGDDDTYYDSGLDIHVDDNDDVIVLIKSSGYNFTYNGDTLSHIGSPGQYSGEGVILKIDNDGNYLWHDDGSVSSTFTSVTTDSTGNIYMTGNFSDSLTLGDSIQLTNPTNGTTRDMFVAKYSSHGSLLWAKNVGGTLHNTFAYGNKIEFNYYTGSIVVLGGYTKDIYFDSTTLSTNSYSTFLVSYDTAGIELWSMSLFNNGTSDCQGLDISPSGLIGVVGHNSISSSSSPDGLIGIYDLNGNIQSENTYYSTNACRLYSLEFNHLNECFVTGVFLDSVTLGIIPDTINLNATLSGFLLKLNSSLLPSWASLLSTKSPNQVTCKNNRILFSTRIDESFTYYYGTQTITNDLGDALFAEIVDPSCPISISVDSQTACDSYTWIDSNTYTSSNNTATYRIPGGAASGCDSLIKLDLTINHTDNVRDTVLACNSYTWIDGVTYTQSNNTASYSFVNSNGCDSIISLNLTINHVSDITITTVNPVISSNNPAATYQWLDCTYEYATIPGETNQSFTATESGFYAVELTENGCVDTSRCISMLVIGIVENTFGEQLTVYPNPFETTCIIDLGATHEEVTMTVHDLNGRLIQTAGYNNAQIIDLELNEPSGVYLLTITSADHSAVVRLVKR